MYTGAPNGPTYETMVGGMTTTPSPVADTLTESTPPCVEFAAPTWIVHLSVIEPPGLTSFTIGPPSISPVWVSPSRVGSYSEVKPHPMPVWAWAGVVTTVVPATRAKMMAKWVERIRD